VPAHSLPAAPPKVDLNPVHVDLEFVELLGVHQARQLFDHGSDLLNIHG
jgi:hypothetical protein